MDEQEQVKIPLNDYGTHYRVNATAVTAHLGNRSGKDNPEIPAPTTLDELRGTHLEGTVPPPNYDGDKVENGVPTQDKYIQQKKTASEDALANAVGTGSDAFGAASPDQIREAQKRFDSIENDRRKQSELESDTTAEPEPDTDTADTADTDTVELDKQESDVDHTEPVLPVV